MDLQTLYSLIEVFAVAVIALILGSFAGAFSYRAVRGLDWVRARSRCPCCETLLRPSDLVPVLSWMIMRGRCRYCRAPVSPRYVLVELATMALCLIFYAFYGLSPHGILLLACAPFLTALILTDLETMLLPNAGVGVVALLGVLEVLRQALWPWTGSIDWTPLMTAGTGFAVFGAMAWLLRFSVGHMTGKEALGLGDVKFFMASGIWLGAAALPYYMLASAASGLFVLLVWRFVLRRGQEFPFGPSLILALIAGQLGLYPLTI